MNRLSTAQRAQIIGMLVEGMSMRAISRITGASINTITKLVSDAGAACAAYHDEHVRDVKAARIECDEIWSFVYAKEKNVTRAVAAPDDAGNAWTWTALDADSKLIVSYLVGDRTSATGIEFMDDLRSRLANRVQLTTDGLQAYLEAVEGAFGGDVDYAMLVKLYGKAPGEESERRYSPAVCIGAKRKIVEGKPNKKLISTSYVERSNLSIRMGNRRFTRLTNAFSKKMEKHCAMLNLYMLHYNFCRIHQTLRVTPAMEAGIDDTVRDHKWIVGLIDDYLPKPKKPGPAKGTKYAPRKSN